MGTPDVTLDVLNAAARITQTKLPTDLYTKYEQIRVHKVTGLDTGVQQQSATMLSRSLVTAGLPQLGSAAPSIPAILVSYSVQPLTEDDSACLMFATYANPLPGSPIAFVVSDDVSLVAETTSLHPNGKVPMLIPYAMPLPNNPVAAPPKQPPQALASSEVEGARAEANANQKPMLFPAIFKYTRPLRKVVVSGYIVKTDQALNPFRAAVGSVNDRRWLRYPLGYWRMDEFKAEGIIFGTIIHVTAAFVSRITEDWRQWEILFSPDIGRRVTVPQADVNLINKLGYFYDFATIGGLGVAGLHPLADFGAIFGFGV